MAGGRDAHFGLQARQFALHFFHRVVALLRLHAAAAAAAAAGRRMHTYLWLDAKYQCYLALI